jgi:hypothetical protein
MSHEHSHSGHDHHNHQSHKKRPIHHQPWLWIAVLLMLGAMAWYVMSDDESLAPGLKPGPQMPAAAE